MENIYIRREGNAACLKVDRWMREIAAILREHRAAIESFRVVEAPAVSPPAEAAGYCFTALPALVVQGELRSQGPITKRALLDLISEETRRMQQWSDRQPDIP